MTDDAKNALHRAVPALGTNAQLGAGRAQQLIDGGRKVVAAGLSLCLYIMPGIGGVEMSREHALESARVVNSINPGYVRFRSLYVRRRSDLVGMVQEGSFEPPSEDEMVREIRTIIENLDGITTTIVSDHILNLSPVV